MAFRLVTALSIGISGITDLRAQLINPTGANVGSEMSTGFTADLGNGQYLWDYSSYPDGFYGAVAIYRASAPGVRWIHAINPQEAENLDDKITSRMATFVYTAPDNAGIASIAAGVSALIATIGAAGAGLTALPGMVWGNSVRTLSSFGLLVADIWSYVTRTLTSGGGATAAEVWVYAERTLTAFGSNTLMSFPYFIENSITHLPLDGAIVRISTDSAGNNTIWVGVTDAFGYAKDIFGNDARLAPGTYYFWRSAPGRYEFQDPDVEVVG